MLDQHGACKLFEFHCMLWHFHEMHVGAIKVFQCYCNEIAASDAQKRNNKLILPHWVLATRDGCDVSALYTPAFGEQCIVALLESATFANTRTMRFPAATRTILSATVARIIRSIFHWNCNQIVSAELPYCKYKGLASARETTSYRCRSVTTIATTTTSVFSEKARSLFI